MVSGRWLQLAAVCVVLPGCQGWPNFDYAPLPDVEINELETDGSSAQYIGTLNARFIISGSIMESGAQESSAYGEFGLDEWYIGDIDYYAFLVPETATTDVALQWTDSDSDLDLFIFHYDSDTSKFDELVEVGDDSDGTQETISSVMLLPEQLYIATVAGREGSDVAYTLVLEAVPEGIP